MRVRASTARSSLKQAGREVEEGEEEEKEEDEGEEEERGKVFVLQKGI